MNKKQKSKVFKFRKIRLSKKSQAYNILEYYLVRETKTTYIGSYSQLMNNTERIKKSELVFTSKAKAYRKCISLNKKRIVEFKKCIRNAEMENKALLKMLSQ